MAILERRVVALIREYHNKGNPVRSCMSLYVDIGMDSVDMMILRIELEAIFKIVISQDVFNGLITVQDVVDYVSNIVHKEKKTGKKMPVADNNRVHVDELVRIRNLVWCYFFNPSLLEELNKRRIEIFSKKISLPEKKKGNKEEDKRG